MKTKTEEKKVEFGTADDQERLKRRRSFEEGLDMSSASDFVEKADQILDEPKAKTNPIMICLKCSRRNDSDTVHFCKGWDANINDWTPEWKELNVKTLRS